MKTNNMMYKRHTVTPIIKTLAALLLLVGGAAQAQTTDTVRIGDPRFMFSQITDTSYFYKYLGNRILTSRQNVHATHADSSARTLSGIYYTMEHKTDGKSIVLYGIALSTTFANYDYRHLPWDHAQDTIWLKVRRGDYENIIDGTHAIDSVRISIWSEKKTLLFDGHPTQIGNDPWILFDSIIYEAVPLYCGYFERPLYIRDTNFYISLELVSHFETMQGESTYPGIFVASGLINTPVTWYKHYYSLPSPCGTTHWCPHTEPKLEWPAILPIIAPRENPSSIDKADNFDLKIYPNPARRQFSVQSGVQVLRVEMYDVMGRNVREWGGSSQSYDLDGIPSGLYTVKVMNAKGSTTKKMMIR